MAHTLVHRLKDWADEAPDREALFDRRGDTWHAWTWRDYWTAVREVGMGLIALGHQVGDRVTIVGDNRPEWVVSQFGMMAVRGIPAPIYTTNTDDQVAFIVDHSKARIAFCDDQQQLDKLQRCLAAGTIELDHIVVMDELASDDPRVVTLGALRALGREQQPTELDRRLSELTDTETSLLIFTSGTTGKPKAVQLDHRGMLLVGEDIVGRFELLRSPDRYRVVSYLPLCHIAEQLFTNVFHLICGGRVYFCPDIKELKDYLVDVRPTLLMGVPRVWEKFEAVLRARLAEVTGLRGRLADWAQRTELAAVEEEARTGETVDTLSRRLADRLVLSKLKARIGLDELLVAATGAAPISRSTLDFFAGLGFTLYEGYGMSETTGICTLSEYGLPRFGTVGRPLDSVRLRIAEDGEVLLQGPTMTRGYLDQPEETKELIDDDGWLHTGDLGSLDSEGYLRVTGRKKDLIITAGGKNVAPAEMEAHLQRIKGVGQAVVVGDRQPYLAALFTVDPEAVPELCRMLNLTSTSTADIARDEAFVAYLDENIEEQCNARVARYQTIKRFKVLPNEFTVEGGELTPTMKVKRNVVNTKYASQIEALYA